MPKEQEESPQGDENVSKDPRSLGKDPGEEKKASQAKSKDNGQGEDTEDSFNPKEAYEGLRSLGDKRYNEHKETLSAIVEKLDQIIQPHKEKSPEDTAKISQEILNKFVEDPIGTISEVARKSIAETPEYRRMLMSSVEVEARSRFKDYDTMKPYMEQILAQIPKKDLDKAIEMESFADMVYDRATVLRVRELAKEGKIKIEGEEKIDKESLKKGEDLNASEEEAVSEADLEPPITGSSTSRRIQDLF